MAEPHRGGDEHVEHRLLGVDVVDQEPALEAEAGVVDQQVDRPGGVGQPGLDGGQLVAVDQVGGQHLDVHAVLAAELLGDGLETGGVAGDQHEVVAAGGELLGEDVADAGGGAGDQCGAGPLGERWEATCVTAKQVPARCWHPGRAECGPMTTTLAIANQKGGVAKTTTVASIGAALAELGHRVLLVDLDPQACLTFSLGIDPEDLELSDPPRADQGARRRPR